MIYLILLPFSIHLIPHQSIYLLQTPLTIFLFNIFVLIQFQPIRSMYKQPVNLYVIIFVVHIMFIIKINKQINIKIRIVIFLMKKYVWDKIRDFRSKRRKKERKVKVIQFQGCNYIFSLLYLIK